MKCKVRMLDVEKGDVSPLNPLGEGLRICRGSDLPTFILPILHYRIPVGAGLNQTQGVNLPRWQGKKVLAGEGQINYDVVTAFTASGYKNKACWSETGTGFAVYKRLWFIISQS